MFKKGQISTEIDRGPFLFSLIAFIGGTITAVLLFALGKGDPLAVFAGIMISIVAVASGAILFAVLTDKAYIDNGVLYMSYLFKKRSIPVKEIAKIQLRNEVYSIYNKSGAVAGTINAKLTSVGDVILELDKSGVNFI